MSRSGGRKSPAPRVVGAGPLGVTEKITVEIGREVRNLFKEKGREAHLRAMRFIPSTLTELDDGGVQVIANTTVEVARAGAVHSETVDSVLTFEKTDGANELRSLSIPALERASS
jgi:hypothetical protein